MPAVKIALLGPLEVSTDVEGAEAMCASGSTEVDDPADVLASLVSKSLVVTQRRGEALRYGLLETIRQYAAEKLEAGGPGRAADARKAHAEYYLELSEAVAPELTGPRQGLWLRRLDLERDNLRAAFGYFSAQPDRTEEILRLGVALYRFIRTRGHLEPVAHLRAALDRPDPVSGALRARALSVTSHLVWILLGVEHPRERRAARQLVESALELARDLGDRAVETEALRVLRCMRFPGRSERRDLARRGVRGGRAEPRRPRVDQLRPVRPS